MKIAFRVDASSEIGSGHLMRCLTLANQLRDHCTEIAFVCRPLPPHLAAVVTSQGFTLRTLAPVAAVAEVGSLRHAAWLGASQAEDAAETLAQLECADTQSWDWLVVDHYAIDANWEHMLRSACRRILVIDDLADRQHDCDALIDQNQYRNQNTRYSGLVPATARQFIGPEFAFLRAEFLAARARLRQRTGKVRHLFIYFGGADPDNYTLRAIQALIRTGRTVDSVVVVIGATHPDRNNIEQVCEQFGYQCHVQTQAMAALMSDADLAVGAGGISTFERLYLRLPALATPISFNQVEQLEYIAELGWLSLYHSDAELARLLTHAIDNGVSQPPDCVGTQSGALARFMLAD